jgi:hypothetical protein
VLCSVQGLFYHCEGPDLSDVKTRADCERKGD